MGREMVRIPLRNDQVEHARNLPLGHQIGPGTYAHTCMFGCNQRASHKIKIGNAAKIYACTKHLVQVFALPPNRPKPKKHVPKIALPPSPDKVRDWTLKQTMGEVLRFSATRPICMDAGIIHDSQFFFSLYWGVVMKGEGDNTEAFSFVSLTSILMGGASPALHVVRSASHGNTVTPPSTFQYIQAATEEAVQSHFAMREYRSNLGPHYRVSVLNAATNFLIEVQELLSK